MKSSTAIWSISTGFSEYFTDKRVRALAEREQLSGLVFRSVLLIGDRISENLYQLLSDQVLERECFVPKKIHRCSVCGAAILERHYQQPLKMDFSRFDSSHDFYMSGRFFGGSSGSAEPIYLISQRFYQLLRQNKLSGGVKFDPVADVNDK